MQCNASNEMGENLRWSYCTEHRTIWIHPSTRTWTWTFWIGTTQSVYCSHNCHSAYTHFTVDGIARRSVQCKYTATLQRQRCECVSVSVPLLSFLLLILVKYLFNSDEQFSTW